MAKSNIIHLIKKILSGTASPNEEQVVNRHLYDSFSSTEWNDQELGDKEEVKERIISGTNRFMRPENHGRIRHLRNWVPYAAAILLLVGLAVFMIPFSKSPQINETATTSGEKTFLSPGTDIASLELSDGTVIDLASIKKGEELSRAGAIIKKTADGNIHYIYANDATAEESAWNTLKTPVGGTFQITLPDGTGVWLNAESSLTFPKKFSDKERRVSATGEVYFEVAHDASKPFTVNTSGVDVDVLGTKFNLSAYGEDKFISIALLEGSVRMKGKEGNMAMLVPGEKGFYEDGGIKIRDFDTESEIAWKNNYFIFKDRNIQDIMASLARWYDADVQYQQGVDWVDKNFTVRMSRRKNIAEILSLIELTQSVKFEINQRKIVVYKN